MYEIIGFVIFWAAVGVGYYYSWTYIIKPFLRRKYTAAKDELSQAKTELNEESRFWLPEVYIWWRNKQGRKRERAERRAQYEREQQEYFNQQWEKSALFRIYHNPTLNYLFYIVGLLFCLYLIS